MSKVNTVLVGVVQELPAISTAAGVLVSNGLLSGTAQTWTTSLIAIAGMLLTGIVHQTKTAPTPDPVPVVVTPPAPVVTPPPVTPPTTGA